MRGFPLQDTGPGMSELFHDLAIEQEERKMSHSKGWIGVDLDGTLAFYVKWVNWDVIGSPVPLMLERVKGWLAEGREVRIFTARVSFENDICKASGKPFTRQQVAEVIQDWLEKNGLPRLQVTHEKDFNMIELWDDRAIQVIPNTGQTIADELASVKAAHEGKVAGQ